MINEYRKQQNKKGLETLSRQRKMSLEEMDAQYKRNKLEQMRLMKKQTQEKPN